MASGLFGDCPNWLDPGCLVQTAASDVGTAVTSALEPVWIILAVLVLLVVLIGTLPNVRHIVPIFA